MTRGNFSEVESGDLMKKAVKLAPNKKSGKEKHTLYRGLNNMDDDDDDDLELYTKRESILDYYDDEDDE